MSVIALSRKTLGEKASKHFSSAAIEAFTQPLQSKVYNWPSPWLPGDCTIAGPDVSGALTGPQLTIYENGTGLFVANCRSTDTGDELGVAFAFLNAAQQQIFHSPHIPGALPDADAYHYQFDISDSDVWKLCNLAIAFDAGIFNQIAYVRPWYQG